LFAVIASFATLLAETPNPELQKPGNPILPDTSELLIATLAFLILFFAMRQWAYPAVRKAMEARTERIRESLDSAERAKTDAQALLDEYQRQLGDARNEANRIIEEARQQADALRRDLMAKAEADAADVRARAASDIETAKSRAMTEMQTQLTNLTVDLAERVVKRNLDREANRAIVEDYISSIGTRR